MKNKIIKTLLLSSAMLCSCGGNSKVDGTFYLGDGFTKRNAVLLNYSISKTLEDGATLSGSISVQENTVIANSYTLAYTSTSPLAGSSSYMENVLCQWSKDLIEANKDGVKFDLTLNLKSVFPSTTEEGTVYFVLHTGDWKREDLTTYGYTDFKYSWNDGKVNLQLD